MPKFPLRKALSYRIPWSSFEIYPGRCQRSSRLQNLPRLCLLPDLHCQEPLQERRTGGRYRLRPLCFRLNNHRSVPVPFSLGTLPENQGGHQAAHLPRSAWLHTDIHKPDSWQCARRQYPRYYPIGKRFRDRHGSWIYRLCKTLYREPVPRFLRNSRQEQSAVHSSRFSESGQNAGPSCRSKNHPQREEIQRCIPGCPAPGVIRGPGYKQTFCLLDQYLHHSGQDRCRYLQAEMAGGTFFPLDTTASENQNFLWHIAQRRQNSDMDRCQYLSIGSHHEKTTPTTWQSPHNSSNFGGQHF